VVGRGGYSRPDADRMMVAVVAAIGKSFPLFTMEQHEESE